MNKLTLSIFLLIFPTIGFTKQPDFLIHNHPHKDIQTLINSKKESEMSYKELMEQFGIAYAMIQNGIITNNKKSIKSGLYIIEDHPRTKNHPWDIVNNENQEAFKESLLYFDEQLHKSTLDIEKSLKSNDWLTINKNIFKLSNHCINCHIIWKDNLSFQNISNY